MNSWARYVEIVANDQTQAQIAAASGVHQATVARWLNGSYVPTDARTVVAFARAYGRSPLEALVAVGVLTEQEARHA